MPDLVIVNCRQLVTLAGPARARTGAEMRELAIIPDGALLARDGRIADSWERAPKSSAAFARMRKSWTRAAASCCRASWTRTRTRSSRAIARDEFDERAEGATYADIAARGGGIRSTVRRTRAAERSGFAGRGAALRAWFLRGGTTTIEAKSGYGLTLEAELKILRVIRAAGRGGQSAHGAHVSRRA